MRYQIDGSGDECGGFLIKQGDTYLDGAQLYYVNEETNDIDTIPNSGFKVNSENNLISISSEESLGTDSSTKYNNLDYSPNIIQQSFYTPTYNGPETIDGTDYKLIPNARGAYLQQVSDVYTELPYIPDYSSNKARVVLRTSNLIVNENNPDPFYFTVKYHVLHVHDSKFIESDQVRLIADFQIISLLYSRLLDVTDYRYYPLPIEIKIRFKKTDGTYISDDASWTKTIDYGYTNYDFSLDSGIIKINNYPNGDNLNGGFGINTQDPVQKFNYVLASIDTEANILALNEFGSGRAYIDGDLCYASDTNTFYKIYKSVTPNALALNAGYPSPQSGDIFWLQYENEIYSYNGSSMVLVDPSNYDNDPTLKGKDLFDLSSMFGSITADWKDVSRMELQFKITDLTQCDYFKDRNGNALAPKEATPRVIMEYKKNNDFKLMVGNETEIDSSDVFVSCDGLDVDDDGDVTPGSDNFPTKIKPIYNNIMKRIFNDKYDTASIDDIQLKRPNIYFRKQFYNSYDYDKVLKGILFSSWSVAV